MTGAISIEEHAGDLLVIRDPSDGYGDFATTGPILFPPVTVVDSLAYGPQPLPWGPGGFVGQPIPLLVPGGFGLAANGEPVPIAASTDGLNTLIYRDQENGVRVALVDVRGETLGDGGLGFPTFSNVVGSDFRDFITGDEQANELWGGDGNDVIEGLDGRDRLRGEEGNDRMLGGVGTDVMWGGEGDDRMLGDRGFDRMRGGEGDDYLRGQRGEDRLFGQEGDDTLIGGRNNDWLEGGSGVDTFVFDGGFDIDTVADFELGVDLIDLSRTGLSDVSGLTFLPYDDGSTAPGLNNDVMITGFGGRGDAIVLLGVGEADLLATDGVFLF